MRVFDKSRMHIPTYAGLESCNFVFGFMNSDKIFVEYFTANKSWF